MFRWTRLFECSNIPSGFITPVNHRMHSIASKNNFKLQQRVSSWNMVLKIDWSFTFIRPRLCLSTLKNLQKGIRWNGLELQWWLCNKQKLKWSFGETKFLCLCWKMFRLFTALTSKHFSRREISYLLEAMHTFLYVKQFSLRTAFYQFMSVCPLCMKRLSIYLHSSSYHP